MCFSKYNETNLVFIGVTNIFLAKPLVFSEILEGNDYVFRLPK